MHGMHKICLLLTLQEFTRCRHKRWERLSRSWSDVVAHVSFLRRFHTLLFHFLSDGNTVRVNPCIYHHTRFSELWRKRTQNSWRSDCARTAEHFTDKSEKLWSWRSHPNPSFSQGTGADQVDNFSFAKHFCDFLPLTRHKNSSTGMCTTSVNSEKKREKFLDHPLKKSPFGAVSLW